MPEFLYKRYKKENKVEEKIKETFDRFHELDVDDSHYVSKFLEVYEKDKMCGRHLFPLKQVRQGVYFALFCQLSLPYSILILVHQLSLPCSILL